MKKRFRFPLKKIFSKLIYDKRFTVPFSIGVAFIMWLVITISQNPVRDLTFNDLTVTVPIENSYASTQGLSIVSDVTAQKFSVVLSGPNYVVSNLTPEDILLTASVEDINTSGTYTLKVTPTKNSKKSGYNFVSVSPATIDVTFDYMDTKEFDVVPRLEGFTAAKGLVAQAGVVTNTENSTISIKGPRAVIENIERVEAFAKVNEELKESRTYDAAIILYNADNEVIYRFDTDGKIYDGSNAEIAPAATYLTLPFTNIKVTAPVVKEKTVTLKATFSDRPEGITDAMFVYTTTPASVKILGAPEVVDKMEQLSLSSISYKNISSKNTTFKATIMMPDGIKLTEEVKEVTVNINYAATNANIKAANQ